MSIERFVLDVQSPDARVSLETGNGLPEGEVGLLVNGVRIAWLTADGKEPRLVVNGNQLPKVGLKLSTPFCEGRTL